MLARLPERARTPAVARAVVSPSAILLAGAGTAAGIALGLGPVAALVGAAAWAARVAMAIPRRPAGARIDPFAVGEPWRRFVGDALQAQRRFDDVVRREEQGPIKARLEAIGRRIGEGVTECWRIARQGDTLDGALRTLDEAGIERRRAEVERDRQRIAPDDPAAFSLGRTAEAIEAQLASARRVRRVAADAHNRLRLLNAQLDEAVARAVEISLQAGDESDLGPLTEDVDGVVHELEALRQALEEAGGGTGSAAAG